MSKSYEVGGVGLVGRRVTYTSGTFVPTGTCFGFKTDVAGDVVFTSGGETLTVASGAGESWVVLVDSITETGTTASVVAMVTS